MGVQPQKSKSLFEKAREVPLVSVLHALPFVGIVFAPLDMARAAEQSIQIKDLHAIHAKVLQRDLNAAVRSGKLVVRRGFGGPNSIEFSTPRFIAARAKNQREFLRRARFSRTNTIATQRILARRAA